jgi:RNA polymerase sigma factor (sigma-70 family)
VLSDQPSCTEKGLFLQISEGNQDAFKDLFNRYVSRLYPYILEVIKSPSGAEDIIQDSFIRIWLNREKLDAIQNPSSWIFKIALHECYNVLRRKMTESKVLGHLRNDHFYHDHYDRLDIQYDQTKRFIAEAIEQLTPQRRKIYELSRINGLNVGQIEKMILKKVSAGKHFCKFIPDIKKFYETCLFDISVSGWCLLHGSAKRGN